jgi:hypothetical protein
MDLLAGQNLADLCVGVCCIVMAQLTGVLLQVLFASCNLLAAVAFSNCSSTSVAFAVGHICFGSRQLLSQNGTTSLLLGNISRISVLHVCMYPLAPPTAVVAVRTPHNLDDM